MKPDAHKPLEKYRITNAGAWSSDERYGNNGAFQLPLLKAVDGTIVLSGDRKTSHCSLRLVVSDGEGWDHVSVSLVKRCPSWEEMCFVKDLFFKPHEVAMQLHPAKADYVNHHPFCLHLWRPQNRNIPLPPSIFVGQK